MVPPPNFLLANWRDSVCVCVCVSLSLCSYLLASPWRQTTVQKNTLKGYIHVWGVKTRGPFLVTPSKGGTWRRHASKRTHFLDNVPKNASKLHRRLRGHLGNRTRQVFAKRQVFGRCAIFQAQHDLTCGLILFRSAPQMTMGNFSCG